jgi:hypothetical protein
VTVISSRVGSPPKVQTPVHWECTWP